MNRISFGVKFENIQEINPLFSLCDIYVCYPDLNRNNTWISKGSIDKNLHTLRNVPIIGEYIESTDNFGSHGGKIEIKDGNVKYIDTTKPYGVVPESAEFTWEDVQEEDGTINEYLVVKGAYLWTGRYEEAKLLIGQQFGQSMELEIVDGGYANIGGKKVYEIRDFIFSALCILGINKESDPDGHVEPCFESGSIIAYSLDKEKFKLEFNQMIKELKFTLAKSTLTEVDHNKELQEGGKDVLENVIEMLKKYSLTIEDLSVKEIDYEQYASIEELEEKVKEVFTLEDNKTTFSLTSEQLESELRRELSGVETITEDWWGEIYSYPRYRYVDNKLDEKIVIAYDCTKCYLTGFSFSVSNDNVAVNAESVTRYKIDYNPMNLSVDVDQGEEVIIPVEVSEYQLKKKAKEFEQQVITLKQEYDAKLQEHQETAFAATSKLETITAELEEAKTQLTELSEFKTSKLDTEKKAKIDTLIEENSKFFSGEEVDEWREKGKECESFESFEKDFKIAAYAKLKDYVKSDKSESRLAFIEKNEDKDENKGIWDKLPVQ